MEEWPTDRRDRTMRRKLSSMLSNPTMEREKKRQRMRCLVLLLRDYEAEEAYSSPFSPRQPTPEATASFTQSPGPEKSYSSPFFPCHPAPEVTASSNQSPQFRETATELAPDEMDINFPLPFPTLPHIPTTLFPCSPPSQLHPLRDAFPPRQPRMERIPQNHRQSPKTCHRKPRL